MVRLNVTASGPAIDVARLAGAVPILIERSRTIGYDSDGTAVIDGERSTSIRLINGVGGQPGATYDLGQALGEPAEVTVETDTVEQLGLRIRGTAEQEQLDGRLVLDRPGNPERLRMNGSMTSSEKTPVLGQQVELDGVLQVAALIADTAQVGNPGEPAGNRSTEPHGTVTMLSKAGRVEASCRIHSSGSRWKVTVAARMKPRGLMLFAGPVWPFLRRRVAAAVAKSIGEFLTDSAKSLAAEFKPGDGPQQVADRVWEELVDSEQQIR